MMDRISVKVTYEGSMVKIPIGTWIELLLFLQESGVPVDVEKPTEGVQ